MDKGVAAVTETPVAGPRLAGWWLRAAAYVLDQTVLLIPLMVLYFVIMVPLFVTLAQDPAFRGPAPTTQLEAQRQSQLMLQRFLPALTGFIAISLLLPTAYFTFFHGWKGQTPGKMAVSIRVVMESGERMTYVRALIRYAVAIGLWWLLWFPGLLDLLWPAWDAKKQALHDKAAGTIVVRDLS